VVGRNLRYFGVLANFLDDLAAFPLDGFGVVVGFPHFGLGVVVVVVVVGVGLDWAAMASVSLAKNSTWLRRNGFISGISGVSATGAAGLVFFLGAAADFASSEESSSLSSSSSGSVVVSSGADGGTDRVKSLSRTSEISSKMACRGETVVGSASSGGPVVFITAAASAAKSLETNMDFLAAQ